jgi:putative colanic acid biosynthesis acetyltransferase WcaF
MQINDQQHVRLDRFQSTLDRSVPAYIEVFWLPAQWLIGSWIPGSWWRRFALKIFGSSIGEGVVIKPRVWIKFPWKLSIGANSWVGESVWIDNLASVRIGSNCCISQDCYLCTGSHDWSAPHFDLLTGAIVIEDSAWIGARSSIAPGVTIGAGAVVALGAVVTTNVSAWTVVQGNPAIAIKTRRIRQSEDV